MSKSESYYAGVIKHKLWVFWYLSKACSAILKRGIIHDNSKCGKVEEPYFRKFQPLLAQCSYGSDEYKGHLHALTKTLKNHYGCNPHHPEHHKDGIHGMSMIDKIEMLCDWAASTKRHKDGSLERSIEQNAERFDYDEVFKQSLFTTAREIGLL